MPVLSNRKRLKKNVILIFSYVYVNELLEEDFFFFTIFHNTSLFIIIYVLGTSKEEVRELSLKTVW